MPTETITLVAPQTELDAVNTMLESIGERPVNDLGQGGRLDVLRAENTLAEINRMVQMRGWWFNLLEGQTLTPSSSKIVLATNTIKFKHIQRPPLINSFDQRRLAMRRDKNDGNKLKVYDLKDRTFTITADVMADLTEGLVFEDLPETARRYIAIRSAVTFQMRTVGSRILREFTEREARESWIELLREQTQFENTQRGLNFAPLQRDIWLLR